MNDEESLSDDNAEEMHDRDEEEDEAIAVNDNDSENDDDEDLWGDGDLWGDDDVAADVDQEWRDLDEFCQKLRENNIRSGDLNLHHDGFAFQLAGCLYQNTSLKAATMTLFSNVTQLGALAVAQGMEHSAMECLILDTMEGLTDSIPWCVVATAIRVLRNLILNEELLTNEFVTRLGQALLLDCSNCQQLELLNLRMPFAGDGGAQELINGIWNLKLATLELENVLPQVCRVLFTNGVLQLPTLRKLHICMHDTYLQANFPTLSQNWNVMGGVANRRDHHSKSHQVSQLETLTLALGCCFRDKEMQLLSEAMRGSPNLKRLCLNQNAITDQGVAYLVENWTAAWPKLETLDLQRNQIGEAGLNRLLIQASSSNSSLRSLDLSNNSNIGHEGVRTSIAHLEMRHGMTKCLLLENLVLKSCDLTDKDIGTLCVGLCNTSSIKSLDLERNSIGDEGVQFLIDGLSNGMQLEVLNLAANDKISAESVRKLVAGTCMPACCSLKTLRINSRQPLTFQDLARIAQELSNSRLLDFQIYVQAANRKIPKAAKMAEREACNKAAKALVTAMKANLHLQDLRLCWLDIPEAAKREIQFFLDLNKSGRQLLRVDNSGLVPVGLWSHILAKHRNVISALYYFLLEQPTLVPCGGGWTTTNSLGQLATPTSIAKKLPTEECDDVGDAAKRRRLV